MHILDYMRNSETDGGRRGVTLEEAGQFNPSERTGSPVGQGSFSGSAQQYKDAMLWTQRTIESAMRGDRWARLRLQEALTTSDFGTLFGDVLSRSILANYAETPYSWSVYAKRAIIQDFRLAKIFRVDRGSAVLDGPLLPNSYKATGSGSTGLEQNTEYPMRQRVASQYTDQLSKFGARMDFAWETLVNDDLDALKDTPALFGRAARRTEEERATKLFVSSTGPNSTFFSNANKNLVNSTVLSTLNSYYGLPNNPPLSITALNAAMVIAANQVDLDGMPISIEDYTLVVPPALKITAMNIVNATQVFMNDQGGTISTPNNNSATSTQRLLTENWARGMVKIAVNYFLNIVDTSHGNTGWYLIANPDNGRPAMQLSFLRGHEMPDLFMKSPNAVKIGEGSMGPGSGPVPGALINPLDGDFDTDSIAYKVRHVLGGTLLDPICAVASNGAGS